MLDHMIFNKLKWFNTDKQPAFGKQVKGNGVTTWALAWRDNISFDDKGEFTNVNGKVISEVRNSQGHYVMTDDHSRGSLTDSAGWFNMDDLTIFGGGVNSPLSACIKALRLLPRLEVA